MVPALDNRDLRGLDGLRLNPRKSFMGKIRGERLTKRKGISIEFADYRGYAEGDDLRHLDWNILARLDSPVMKTYQDEEDLAVHLLIDASESMRFGEPTKLEAALNMALVLGCIGLAGGDAVYPHFLGSRRPPVALRGRSSLGRLRHELGTDHTTDSLSSGLQTFVSSRARSGLCVLLSDGLDPALPNAIRHLGARGHELLLLTILSDVELDPDLEGDLRLIDCESGQAVEITANSYALKEYKSRLNRHLDELAESTRKVGGRYARVSPTTSISSLITDTLKREGWVR